MKRVRFLALTLAILMMATIGFAESATDPIVVKAGDATLPLSEAQAFFDDYYAQFAQMYAEADIPFTKTELNNLLNAIMSALEEKTLMDGKIAEYGLGEITDADKEALRTEVEANFETDLAAYAQSLNLTVEEARDLVASQGITLDLIYEQSLLDLPYDRLYDYLVKDVTVTDEDVAQEYETYVEQDKEVYANDVASYEMYSSDMFAAYYGPTNIFYVPEGFRYVKNLLLAMPVDIATEINSNVEALNEVQTAIDKLSDELYALENAEEGADTSAMRSEEEIQADLDVELAKQAELDQKQVELNEQVLPSLQPIIDEINTKLAAGTSFDALIEEYNTDPGMANNPEGYKVHKDSIMWDTTFRDVAMALENIGDVSEPFLTSNGVHIVQYASDVPSGAVPMTDEIKAELEASLLSMKQEEVYQTAYEGWLSGLEIETHPELIKLPEVPDAAPEDATENADTTAPEGDEAANSDGSVG